MLKYYDFCPKCQGIRYMSMSISLRKVTGPDGLPHEILVTNYHCETCSSFIFSLTALEEQEKKRAGNYEMQPTGPWI